MTVVQLLSVVLCLLRRPGLVRVLVAMTFAFADRRGSSQHIETILVVAYLFTPLSHHVIIGKLFGPLILNYTDVL